jgi:hypothetical protein
VSTEHYVKFTEQLLEKQSIAVVGIHVGKILKTKPLNFAQGRNCSDVGLGRLG